MSEVIIYQAEDVPPIPLPVNYGDREDASVVFTGIAKILAVLGVLIIVFSYIPSAWYSILGTLSTKIASIELSKKEVELLGVEGKGGDSQEASRYTPAFDPSLPTASHLSISSIGVDTALQEATYDNYEAALRKGVWRVSDFGAPDTAGTPVILAAHRFGYLVWTNSFRRLNSFYNLPKVKAGDTVTIVFRQRKYTYEVYAATKDTEIKDYTADLILYTCENLTGPERVFVYARLLEV